MAPTVLHRHSRAPVSKVTLTLRLFKALGLFALAQWITRRKPRILCYHGLWYGGDPKYGDCLYMDPETFEHRMDWLAHSGYPVLSLDEALRRLDDSSLPDRAVVITIDDGWYSTYRGMVPVLHQLSLPATLYVTTYYVKRGGPVLNVLLDYLVNRASTEKVRYETLLPDIAPPSFASHSKEGRDFIAAELAQRVDALEEYPSRIAAVKQIATQLDIALEPILRHRIFDLMTEDELRSTRDAGVDIQLHTHTHRMHGMDAHSVTAEIDINRSELANILSRDPKGFRHFCYPSGIHSERVFNTLRACGIASSTTTHSGLVDKDDERMSLKRILDCRSMSQIEFEARLCGLWDILLFARDRFAFRKSSRLP